MRNLSVVESNTVVGGLSYADVKDYVHAAVGGVAGFNGATLFSKRSISLDSFCSDSVKGVGAGLVGKAAEDVMNYFNV